MLFRQKVYATATLAVLISVCSATNDNFSKGWLVCLPNKAFTKEESLNVQLGPRRLHSSSMMLG